LTTATRQAVRLLIVDDGSYHEQTVIIPTDVLAAYDRLIDCLREDPAVLKTLYVDLERLAGAWLVDDEE
jgi:hypothetical protein